MLFQDPQKQKWKWLTMKCKREYQVLLDSGELGEMYPELTGVWSKDKKKFTEYWEKNQEAILNLDFEDYEEL